MQASPVRFGILGPGKIAHRFADAFAFVPDATLQAVASRDPEKGRQFASKYGIPACYDNYEALMSDPAVDVVYIATPHSFHHEQTLQCLEHGKAVLCEKPMAINARQTGEMVALARKKKIFLMEAMWARFFPALDKVLELLNSGAIGTLKYVSADFCFAGPVVTEGRLYNTNLGGGAQLDVGIYPLFLATLLLGKPARVLASASLAETGADLLTAALLEYPSGAKAHILSAIANESPKDAHLLGTNGRIVLKFPWWKSEKVQWLPNQGEMQEFSFPHSGNGFEFEIRETVRCIREGKKESSLHPLDQTLLMAEISDEIRRQCGIRYPED